MCPAFQAPEPRSTPTKNAVNLDKAAPNLIDAVALSQIIGVDKGTIYDWVRRGKIPHVRLERLVRFDLKDIDEWVRDRKQNLSKSPLSRHEQ